MDMASLHEEDDHVIEEEGRHSSGTEKARSTSELVIVARYGGCALLSSLATVVRQAD